MEGQAAFPLLELFRLGGPVMWPLTLFSVATVAIGIDRALFVLRRDLRLDDLADRVSALVEAGDFAEAAAYLAPLAGRRPGARVLLALLEASAELDGRRFSERRVEKAAETEAAVQVGSLEGGLGFLVALGSVAPLTGFLGTVTGMIGAFRAMAEAAEVSAQVVAGGIYEALITTVYGLAVAIAAMILHAVFSNVADRFAADLERVCSGLVARIADARQAAPA